MQFRNILHGEPGAGDDRHWGWESPTCQIRGHFLGHWLSAMSRIFANTGDLEAKLRVDKVVAELGRCQQQNGGEWVASIPVKYLDWLAQGLPVWAPQYVAHKTMMGLFDSFQFAGSTQALEILEASAKWFHRWTSHFSLQEMDNILDVETGGMLELWADLYGVTGKSMYLDLIGRYDRRRLFDRLLRGEDPLTNRHANTTIPEAIGAARTYEVTGETRWRQIAEAYWRCAVTNRGTFCTGGQTSGEIWTPPFKQANRLGDKTQEHCTVYNLIRLADFLLRWTGDVQYADYIERNLYNGILAQQHRKTGMVTYFLPMQPGARKIWGSPTYDFWCCHGTLVQAHTSYPGLIYYQDEAGLVLAQYLPSQLKWNWKGIPITLTQTFDKEAYSINALASDGPQERPQRWVVVISINSDRPTEFGLKLRLPEWLSGEAKIELNGLEMKLEAGLPGFATIQHTWMKDTVRIELPMAITISPLPDEPEKVAFLNGPVVLAGLIEGEPTLNGKADQLENLLRPDDERVWGTWKNGYRTIGQPENFHFRPLYEVIDEAYTVYFPLHKD